MGMAAVGTLAIMTMSCMSKSGGPPPPSLSPIQKALPWLSNVWLTSKRLKTGWLQGALSVGLPLPPGVNVFGGVTMPLFTAVPLAGLGLGVKVNGIN